MVFIFFPVCEIKKWRFTENILLFVVLKDKLQSESNIHDNNKSHSAHVFMLQT